MSSSIDIISAFCIQCVRWYLFSFCWGVEANCVPLTLPPPPPKKQSFSVKNSLCDIAIHRLGEGGFLHESDILICDPNQDSLAASVLHFMVCYELLVLLFDRGKKSELQVELALCRSQLLCCRQHILSCYMIFTDIKENALSYSSFYDQFVWWCILWFVSLVHWHWWFHPDFVADVVSCIFDVRLFKAWARSQ